MHRGIATFTLDYGQCPPWLFQRMVKLGREMTRVLVDEYGPDEFVKRIADPVWFQSLGTVLAFDWNASGLTTILTAALKEAIRGQESDLGIFICGGKGKTSRKTPDEISHWGERLNLSIPVTDNLANTSKMAAKVDSSLVQDGYQIYHHSLFFTLKKTPTGKQIGSWAVVQQGMNTASQSARRYHWWSDTSHDLINEPHAGIASQAFLPQTLNLTTSQSGQNRDLSVELVGSGFPALDKDIRILRKHSSQLSQTIAFSRAGQQYTYLQLFDQDFHHHPVEKEDFWQSSYLDKILQLLCDLKPQTYQQLLATPGVGPKTIRALSLVAEVIYGAQPSYIDPARYSFAHGGKDHIPYPIDRPTYDQTISILRQAMSRTHLSSGEKDQAVKRLTKP